MYLYHYSNIDKPVLKVDPKYFGQHLYTRDDADAVPEPRSFWYLNPKDKESMVTGGTLYRVAIPAEQLYDLNKDKDNLYGDEDGLSEYIMKVLKKGYKGIIYGGTSGMPYKVANLFQPIEATRVNQPRYAKLENINLTLKNLLGMP